MRIRSSFNRHVSAAVIAAIACLTPAARAQTRPAAGGPGAGTEDPARDAVLAGLYRVVLEDPAAPEVSAARLQLATVLALTGNTTAALLQAQLAKEAAPEADEPIRAAATNLATVLGRRLRGPSAFFPVTTPLSIRGLMSFDSPSAIDVRPSGEFLIVDAGAGRAFRVNRDRVTPIVNVQDLSAAVLLPDGSPAVAGKAGLNAGSVTFSGTWGGKPRAIRKVRAITVLNATDLLVVDRDFDGLLRCVVATGACTPWGPPGKVRTVKAGASGYVYLLDDRQQSIRVVDSTGRVVSTLGPTGPPRLDEVVDIAVDAAHGLYALDKNTRRVEVFILRSTGSGQVALSPLTGMTIRQDVVKNPSAIGVAPDGAVLVAGRSESRLVKFQ